MRINFTVDDVDDLVQVSSQTSLALGLRRPPRRCHPPGAQRGDGPPGAGWLLKNSTQVVGQNLQKFKKCLLRKIQSYHIFIQLIDKIKTLSISFLNSS